MNLNPQETKKYISKALRDQNLREAVRKATESTIETRTNLINQIPEWQNLRESAHKIKKHVIWNLDRYLKEFERNCQEQLSASADFSNTG